MKEISCNCLPYFGIDTETNEQTVEDAFNTTKELYYKEFSERITATRSQYPTIIYYFLLKSQRLFGRKKSASLKISS